MTLGRTSGERTRLYVAAKQGMDIDVPIRPHRHALGEARAVVAALSPAARGRRGGGVLSPWDYYHVGAASGLSVSVFSRGTGSNAHQFGTTQPGAAELSASPFWVGRTGLTITSLGVRASAVSAFATVSVELGVFDNAPLSDRSIYPRNRLAVGTVSYVTTSEVGLKRVNIAPLELSEGLYWFTFLVISPTNPRSWNAPVPDSRHPETPFMGRGPSVAANGPNPTFGYYVGGQLNTPSAYPAGALISDSSTPSKRCPAIFTEVL